MVEDRIPAFMVYLVRREQLIGCKREVLLIEPLMSNIPYNLNFRYKNNDLVQ